MDLSALFSFRCAAGELMCASQIFMEDHESSLSSRFLQEEVRRLFKCRTFIFIFIPQIFFWVTIFDFLVKKDYLIKNDPYALIWAKYWKVS